MKIGWSSYRHWERMTTRKFLGDTFHSCVGTTRPFGTTFPTLVSSFPCLPLLLTSRLAHAVCVLIQQNTHVQSTYLRL